MWTLASVPLTLNSRPHPLQLLFGKQGSSPHKASILRSIGVPQNSCGLVSESRAVHLVTQRVARRTLLYGFFSTKESFLSFASLLCDFFSQGLPSIASEEDPKNMKSCLWIKKNRGINLAKKMCSVKHPTQREASSIFSCTKAKNDRLCGMTMGTHSTVTGEEVNVSTLTFALGKACQIVFLFLLLKDRTFPTWGIILGP